MSYEGVEHSYKVLETLTSNVFKIVQNRENFPLSKKSYFVRIPRKEIM